MKGRIDKSMGIVTLIVEDLDKIKPTDPLIFTKRATHKKRNYSDSSGNFPDKIQDYVSLFWSHCSGYKKGQNNLFC